MSQWTIQIESTADGRYRWRHVPVDGSGDAHAGSDHYDSREEAQAAGEQALARHHEKLAAGGGSHADAAPETPAHEEHTRLGGSQADLETQEDPRLRGDSPVSMSNLPVEAQVRTADEEGASLARS